MARLIYVPVVHSTVEMGSEASAYKAAFIARYGELKWAERSAEFDEIWRAIRKQLDALCINFRRVKLYQDSLPVCGQEAALVHDLAARGSRNHQMLEALAQKGAALVGTESPGLLLDEYRLLQSQDRTEAKEAELLRERDRFIATRIDETLGVDETGILFIGALHKVADYLPARIIVDYVSICGR